jgi:FkbM family methyltransferase
MSAVSALRSLNCARLWRRRLSVWGHTLRASSLDRLVCLVLHRLELMGKADRRLLERLVTPGMTVVDIGANLGLYTLLFSKLTGPAGHVYAFEPEPTLYRALCSNCRRNGAGNITTLNYALGRQPGRTTFYRSLFNSGDNRLGGLGWQGQRLDVDMVRLDDALPGCRVDFIKLDVQGFELQVLQGMDELSRRSKNLRIYFEFWPRGLRAAGTRPEAVLEHLERRDFAVYRVEHDGARRVTNFALLSDGLRGGYINLLAAKGVKPC